MSSIVMQESRILAPHRPRRYSILDVADVTNHDAGGPARWLMGARTSSFGTELHHLQLNACDFEVSGWPVSEGDEAERSAFTSLLTGECQSSSGPDTLDEMRRNIIDEHRALLPEILDHELILGATSNDTDQSLAGLADAGAVFSGAPGDLIAHAEGLTTYESIILVPLAVFASATNGTVERDEAGRLRTKAGNLVAPQTADDDVYVLPAPLRLDLVWAAGPPSEHVRLSSNTIEVFSSLSGLFEVPHSVTSIAVTLD